MDWGDFLIALNNIGAGGICFGEAGKNRERYKERCWPASPTGFSSKLSRNVKQGKFASIQLTTSTFGWIDGEMGQMGWIDVYSAIQVGAEVS
jgi:hypothetical protein